MCSKKRRSWSLARERVVGLGPLDCADKKGWSCERGAKPAAGQSISMCHLSHWTTVDYCHVRPIQAVRPPARPRAWAMSSTIYMEILHKLSILLVGIKRG